MDFEKAYQKFLDGTATKKEIEFVRKEMKKANEINDILNKVKKEHVIEDAEKETVKKAMKIYWKKDTLKIILIVSCSILILGICIACAIGLPILNNAKNNMNYTKEEAKEIARQYVLEKHPSNKNKIEIYKVEKELEVEGRIKRAHYIYVVEIYNGKNDIYEIEIDSKTGNIIEVD